jgi:hypothetical protein
VSRAVTTRTLTDKWRDDIAETIPFDGGRVVVMKSSRDSGEITVLTAMEPL